MVIDIPVGPTAKVRSKEMAEFLFSSLKQVGDALGIQVKVVITDGTQPVGFGIGPALEARDVMKVLQCAKDAPQDLREHALLVAAEVLEFSPRIAKGEGYRIASEILDSGKAWQKFQAICKAQGGVREIPIAPYTHAHVAEKPGRVASIDNRRIALLAKLAGAPHDKAAGIDLHVKNGEMVQKGQPLFTIHAEAPGELAYTLDYLKQGNEILSIV